VKLTTYYHLVLRLRKSGIVPLLPTCTLFVFIAFTYCPHLLPWIWMKQVSLICWHLSVTIHHISDLNVNTHHHENQKSHLKNCNSLKTKYSVSCYVISITVGQKICLKYISILGPTRFTTCFQFIMINSLYMFLSTYLLIMRRHYRHNTHKIYQLFYIRCLLTMSK
jgi:hypothetical protein